jgi:hypothetical protein
VIREVVGISIFVLTLLALGFCYAAWKHDARMKECAKSCLPISVSKLAKDGTCLCVLTKDPM